MKDLFFRIKAVDKTAAAFAKVKAGLKSVEGAAASLNERINRVGKGMRNVGAVMTGFGAGLALAFRDSLTIWDEAAQAQTKVEQAVRSTGSAAGFTAEQLAGFAAEFQRVTRFDGDDILGDVTAQLLTFTNVSGEVFKRAQEAVLNISTVMKTDLKSTAISVGKALNDPIKGLGALGRAGIQFSKDQQAAIKALVETGNLAAAQQIMLDEIAIQFGGQAEAAAQAGLGFLDQFRNAWGDVQEIVGGNLAELARPLVGALQAVVDCFKAFPEPLQKFTVMMGLAAVVIGPIVAAAGLLAIAVGAIGAPVAAVIVGVAALAAALVALWPTIEAGIDWFKRTVESMSFLEMAFMPLSLAARALGDVFAAVFPETAAVVKRTVEEIREWLVEGLRSAFDWVMGKVEAVGDAFFNLYDRVVGHSYVPDMIDGVSAEFQRLQPEMVDPVKVATVEVGSKFQDLGSGVGGAIGEMVREGDFTFRGFAERMVENAGRMADSIVNDAFGRVAEAAKSLGGGTGIGGFFGKVLGGLFGSGGGNVPGFASGGDFEVGGRGGIDRNVAVMRVSRGERVSIDPAGGGGRAAAAPVTVNISTPNPAAFDRSRGQVAATVARAVARGQRNL